MTGKWECKNCGRIMTRTMMEGRITYKCGGCGYETDNNISIVQAMGSLSEPWVWKEQHPYEDDADGAKTWNAHESYLHILDANGNPLVFDLIGSSESSDSEHSEPSECHLTLGHWRRIVAAVNLCAGHDDLAQCVVVPRELLSWIASACGNPNAADGCRAILKRLKEVHHA